MPTRLAVSVLVALLLPGCSLLDALSPGKIGDSCEVGKECAGGSCIRPVDGGHLWLGGYCTARCDTDGGGCPTGAACGPWDKHGGACIENCTWDGGQSDCRPDYVCDRYNARTGGSCVPKCTATGDCGRTALGCEKGFCCGGHYDRCCTKTTACGSGYLCDGQDYCLTPAEIADGGVGYAGDGGTGNAGCGSACIPTVLASNQNGAGALAITDTAIFWADEGTGAVMRMPLAGGTPSVLVTGPPGHFAIAADANNVYLTDPTKGVVFGVPVRGGMTFDIALNQNGLYGIATDGTRLLWTNRAAGQVVELALGKAASPQVIAGAEGGPGPIVLGQHAVYWADLGGTGNIMRAPFGGGTPTAVATGVFADALAVDASNVYFHRRDGRFAQVPIAGGPTVVLTPNHVYTSSGIAAEGPELYFTDGQTGRLFRVPIGGGTPTPVSTPAAGGLTPDDLVATSRRLYWTDKGPAGEVMTLLIR